MAEVDLEFLGRQVALLLDGQREIKADLGTLKADVSTVRAEVTLMKAALAETATRELMLRMLRSFEGQVEIAGIRSELLRETLESRIKATRARIAASDGKLSIN